jgi:hypothetical protein
VEIRYDIVNGRLKFFYCPSVGMPEMSGLVPEGVVAEGTEQVETYVRKRISDRKVAQKRRKEKYKARRKKLNVPIEIQHGRSLLRGRVRNYEKSDRSAMQIILEWPKRYHGSSSVITMCMGLAWAGKQIFNGRGGFTDWAIERARNELVEIYEEKKKKEKKRKSNRHAYKVMRELNEDR